MTQQYEAVGHAVRAIYTYSGMADVAVETHDPDYQSAVKSLWDNMVNKKYYVTGGVGSGETSEGFGPNYSLRNHAYCESCSSCGAIFFQWKMNLAYHDAKYADLYEETMYNALLGSTDLDGKNLLLHQSAGCQRRRGRRGTPARAAWATFPRTLLMMPTWMYAKSPDGVYVNLFVGSTITLENVAGHGRRDGAGHRLPVERQGRHYGEPEDLEELRPAHPRAGPRRQHPLPQRARGERHHVDRRERRRP